MANRVLLISLSNIGDAIMTTPVMEALHRLFPAAVIDIVADARSAELFRHCPYRGEVYFKNKKDVFRGGWSLLKDLRENYYDLIVDLRTDGFAYLLRGRKRLTKWNKLSCGPHSVEQHMGVIRSIYECDKIPACRIWPGEDDRDYAGRLLDIYKGKRFLGLGPGANFKKKIWPPDKYVSLIEQVENNFDVVILFGGKRDSEYAKHIKEHIKLPCINLCEKTTLLQAAAVMGHIDLYMGNDSGLGHMAAAMGIFTLTIFGPGHPERYRPWGNKAMLVASDRNDVNSVLVDDVVKTLHRSFFGCNSPKPKI